MSCREFSIRVEKCGKAIKKAVKKEFGGTQGNDIGKLQNRRLDLIKCYAKKYKIPYNFMNRLVHCNINKIVKKEFITYKRRVRE